MEDLFKKFINAGVGYLAQGNKKVQSTIDALVKESKLSEQEGKKIVEDLLKSGETKRTALEKQFKGLAERMKDSVGLATKAAAPAKKAPAKKAPAKRAGAPKAASSVASKVAGATKKAADKASAAAGTAQKSAAAKAGAAPKAGAPKAAAKPRAAKKTAAPAADSAEA